MKAERLFRAIGLVDEGSSEAPQTPAKSGPSGGGMRLRRPA